jgi:hypothetical protein
VSRRRPTKPSSYLSYSYCCCSSPHAAEIWALLVSTTLCVDAVDDRRAALHRAARCGPDSSNAGRRSHTAVLIAIWTVARISPAPTPKAVNPRMRSLSTFTRAFTNPRAPKRACTQVGFHWGLKQAIRYPFSLRFCFTQADTSQLGVGKQTIGDLPAPWLHGCRRLNLHGLRGNRRR